MTNSDQDRVEFEFWNSIEEHGWKSDALLFFSFAFNSDHSMKLITYFKGGFYYAVTFLDYFL